MHYLVNTEERVEEILEILKDEKRIYVFHPTKGNRTISNR